MGLLADFFVATKGQALLYEASLADRAASIEKYRPAEYRNLTGLELGLLWAILTNEEWDVDKHMLTLVETGESGETWLLGFPDQLVDSLAGLGDSELLTHATKWADTEPLERWDTKHTQKLLFDLRRLSRDAKSSGSELFLWISL